MSPDTRTSHGIDKTIAGAGSSPRLQLRIKVEEVHGRIHLRRSINDRSANTDVLTLDEAEHLFTVGLEAVQRSRGTKGRA